LDDAYSNFSKHVDITGEMRRIEKKRKESCKILGDSIREFKEALEMTKQAEKEIIQLFLEKGSEDINMERLALIEQKFLDLTDFLAEDKKVWDLMAHTLNAYDVCFSNELGFLREIYTDETCLAMARVKKIKDWFSTVGMFLTLTKDLLEKTENRLDEEITAG